MEKLSFAYRKRLTRTGMACALGLCMPQVAPFVHGQESVVQKELNRRIIDAREAHDLLHSGDEAYNKQNYKSAVQFYAQAFSLLPGGSISLEMREAAAERYATAATERSRKLAKAGKYDEAKLLLTQVLQPDVAPAHMAALQLQGQIDDPIRYNQALTPQHVSKVQEVGMKLRKAEAYHNLGQYDQAIAVYSDVLKIDPFNKAARRSMERIEATKSDYYRAARDSTRAQLIGAVDKGWELAIPSEISGVSAPIIDSAATVEATLLEKLEGITVDIIELDNATLSEALDFVRVQSRIGDAPTLGGTRSGINLVLTLGDPNSELAQAINSTRVDLKARSLPLSKLLDYITDQTHTQWRSDGASILVTPLGSTSETMMTRTFRVPPNFMASAGAVQSDNSENIFGDGGGNSEGLIPQRKSITEFLQESGINFPEGATAKYTPSSNTLMVRNTTGNIDLIDQLVTNISSQEPIQVIVRTTIMRVSQKKLEALGFDWMITPVHLSDLGSLFLGGGTTGNGTELLDMPLSPFSGLGNPISTGLRSGDTGLHADSIDTFLGSADSGFGSSEVRAPGILTLTGVYSGMQVQMMMRGMSQKTGADVLQKPSTVARSGERSKIEIIRELIYPTEYEPPELPNSVNSNTNFDPLTGEEATQSPPTPVTPSHPTAFETRNTGVTLEVEPTVGPNKKYIELSLRPELVEFEGFVNYGSPINGSSGSSVNFDLAALGTGNVFTSNPGSFGVVSQNRILMPVFKTTRLKDSNITIQDGATIVLGGLMTSRKTKIEDKIPLLGDMPVVGRLFRSEADQTEKVAVVITVQAELVDPSGRPLRKMP